MTDSLRRALLYHFCRLQMPAVALAPEAFERHLDRTFALYGRKKPGTTFADYLDSLYSLDWYLCSACLDGDEHAWELLFAARTGRSDCLLVDALRARATRLYPRDEEKQESAVAEFWSQLLVAESAGGTPVLARYDGQRPLIPWLIRVFQNAHISKLRSGAGIHGLPDDDIALPLPDRPDNRWHEAFCQAARESLAGLSDAEMLILGLRLRYRLSQREAAHVLGVHEGTISRQTDKLRDRCLEQIRTRLLEQGWTGDDLSGFVLTEMGPLLLDEPRLGADRLAGLLAARGKPLPDMHPEVPIGADTATG
jgi:RNA polymerase sigma factor (sigma-70 family)